MIVRSQGNAAAHGRSKFLSVCLGALALACGFLSMPALAQTSVTNVATVAPPDGVFDANPDNDSDDALISVTAPLPDFGSCDASMYLAQNAPTGLFEFDTSSNPFDVNPVGPTSAITYNAIAYNPVDNYIYGLRGPAPGTLVRVGSDGRVEDVGTIANFPTNSVVGEIGPDGTYYTATGSTLYRIDIASMTATPVALSQGVSGQDMAWHNDRLYMAAPNSGPLYEIDPTTGNVTPLGSTGVTGSFGGMFGASNGVFGSNNDGGFYRFDLATGHATLISDLPGSGNNDGAKCATTPLEFPGDLSITKDDGKDTYVQGTDNVYSIVVSNLGPFGVSGALVSDPLPAGITNATWTCGNATGGGVCTVPSGTGAIADVPVNLPAGASVTFTLTMPVPDDFSGELVNTATVTAPAGSPDSNPANNTATDTDTAAPAVVTVAKASNPAPGTQVSVGQTITYTVTTTITGGVTSDVVTLTDTPSAGLALAGVTNAGDYICNAALPLVCTLPAGTRAGTYTLEYAMTVGADAADVVGNTVVPTGGDDPTCTTCTTQHPVQPNFGTCDATMYLGIGAPTQLVRVDTSANPFTYPPIGAPYAAGYNAMGYDPVSNYIYATRWDTATSLYRLLRVGGDGSVVDLGPITGGGINAGAGIATGVVGADGNYYVKVNAATSQMWRVDLATRTATRIPLNRAIASGDWAWYDGRIYVHDQDTGLLSAIDPSTGAVTTVGPSGISGNADAFGTMISASNGVFGRRNSGGFYRFDTTTGRATLISDAPAGGGDGDKCPTTPVELPVDLSITKDDGSDTYVQGEETVYSIVVSNLGPFGVQGALVSDPLPAGITNASWTCGNATGGGVCGVASGSGAIADVPVDLPAGASVTFTLTMPVPDDFSGELVNTATVTAPAGSPDSNPANNTATDTDTAAPAVVTVAKASNPAPGTQVSVGQTITYTVTTTITGGLTSDVVTLTDTPSAGLAFAGVTNAGAYTCNTTLPLVCTLPARTAAGTYTLEYAMTVGADAADVVGNTVVPTGGDDPTCTTCTTQHTVQPTFGTCDATMYLSQNNPTGLFRFDTSSNPFPVDPVGPNSGVGYNGIAYNPVDNYIYGLQGPAPGTLIRVGSDGSVVELGTIANFPTNSVVGEFGPDGTYYTAVGSTLYRVDIATRTATPITLSMALTGQDFAWHDGRLYMADRDSGPLFIIDPATGNVSAVGSTGVAGSFGGMFGASNGVFGSNNNGGFYRFDLATGRATLISDLPGSDSNDGAKCAAPPLEFPGDLSITKDDGKDTYVQGTDNVYSIVVSNLGPFGVSGALVSDPLPAGVTDATWTCGNATGGGVCGVASGSGAIADVPVDLPAGASVTFTLTMPVPDDFSGELVNTATVTAPAGSPDSNPANNTATDTDTAEPGVVTVAKAANPAAGTSVEAGDTLTYTLTYTVTGGNTTEDSSASDQLGAGLSFGAVGAISDPTRLSCTGTSPLVCTLAEGTPAGTYTVQYTATVDADASGTVANTVSGVPCTTPSGCTTTHEVSSVTVGKSASPASGASVEAGDTLTYTLTYTVAGGASTEAKTATDQLGPGLTFGAVGTISDPARLSCTGSAPMACTLAAGAPAGTYTVQYTATVDAAATGTVTNTVSGVPCTTPTGCTTEHPLSSVTVAKAANPADGASVEAGDTLTYTLTYTVTGGASTQTKTVTDQLGPGLTFGAVGAISDPARLSCTGTSPMACTLAAGAPAGTYTVQYTATVDADATGTVTNTVSGVPCATATGCTTTHTLSSVSVGKTASPASGGSVEAGDTLTYTLTFTVVDGASTEAKTATDQLGPGLTFGAVGAISDPARLSCSGSAPMTCTLAAGAPPGTYIAQYTATVDAAATGTVTNTVSGLPCTSPTGCTTEHPLSTVTVAKTANPADGASVEAGDTLTYTLTYTVTGGASTEPKTATDQLGPGLTFGAVGAISDPARLSCTGTSPMACTLAAGAPAGTYTVQYTATVDADATGTVTNTVSGVPCATATGCTTTHTLSSVSVGKTASPASGGSVEAGDTLTYTLTFTVVDGASTEPKTATDQLGPGLTFGAVGAISDPARLSCSGSSPLTCTLAAGSPPGTYTVQYTATVDADATGTVTNTVSGLPCSTPTGCTTTHTLSSVTVGKAANPASGTSVEAGDTLTYTLTYTVADGASTEPKIATDQLGAGLTFGTIVAISDPARLSCSGSAPMTCTLAAGAPPGNYTVQYTATVDAAATGTVTNTVSGVPCTTPTGCTTEHPLSSVTVAKTANPTSGASVEAGDTLTYTLTYTVTGGASTEAKTATDQLGPGLTFGAVGAISDPGRLSCTGTSPLACTLAAGAPAGTYTVQYTATVDAAATGSVTNTVSGVPCATASGCTTTHPLSSVTVGKSANPASGASVEAGDTLTYTLTYTVTDGASAEPKTATDQLGAGLTFGTIVAISDPARLSCSGSAPMTCTLAAGAPVGTYTVQYTATVDAGATGTVTNTVSGVPCTTPSGCTTTHTLSAVTVEKDASPASGASVEAGDTLTYTLTYTVTGGSSTEAKTATDQLGPGLTFGALGAISDPGRITCSGSAPLTCTLAAGAPVGTYTIQYTATVDASATGTVTNTVSGVPCATASGCTTEHPLSSVTVAKRANPASGNSVEAGDTLTYMLTYTVTGGASTEAKTATDQLGAGLSFGAVAAISDPARLSCTGTSPLACTLAAGAPAGTYTVQYTATVDADATGTVTNTVSGVPCATAGGCTTTHTLSAVTVGKTANPASGASVEAGDTLTYTLTYTVSGGPSTEAKTATDQLGPGLAFGAVGAISDPGRLSCSGSSPLTCTLAAGAPVGTYTVQYTATVDANAAGTVTNTVSGVPCATASGCTTEHPLSSVTVAKRANPASGNSVEAGDTLTYMLTYTVTGGASTEAKTATDQLGAGLSFGAVAAISDPARLSCSGTPMVCTLAAGAPPGSYTVQYTATVDAAASGTVTNTVSGLPCATATGCSTTHNLSAVTVAKTASPASGNAVEAGDTLTYTLTYTVTGGASSEAKAATDRLGAGLTFGAVRAISDPGLLSCSGAPMVCTLAAGAPAGTYTVEYTATVDADATGPVTNTVSGVPCTTADGCATSHDLSSVTVGKSADPASGTPVDVGQTLTYTLTYTVAGGASADAKTATDQLGPGLRFGEVGAISDPDRLSCSGTDPLSCTLAAGAPVGTYTVQYTAIVDADATGAVTNTVAGVPCTAGATCVTEHPLRARVDVVKSANPAAGAEVHVGDTIEYTLTATVGNGTTTEPVRLIDTPGAGLTIGAVPAGCTAESERIYCTLAAGAAPGVYTFVYTATIDASASGNVRNAVVSDYSGRAIDVSCLSCDTEHRVAEQPSLRIVKNASVREAKVGDLVRYTLTVENVGSVNATDVDVVDTPPAGFTFVAGSLSVVDRDNAASASGHDPIRFEGIDVDAGETATLTYLMRVGAGVRPGIQRNQAQAHSGTGEPISNVATAEVALVADPLVDDSLIVGSVFDDRDGDGWQDSAALTGVRVQGGFDPSAYVPDSTTIDRGAGPQPLPDASAPLLHGIDVGQIGARQSEADPAQRRQVVISQRLTRPDFTGDFVLTTKQGATLRMGADGTTTVSAEGEAAKGLNAAAPAVERRIAQGEGGYVVDYVIRNDGIDERGIPGVRIASVDGLLVETDQFGRYHLEGIPGGAWARGRNFILKVDPSTLPPGTQITTDNPLVRRITPGVPVRFDFGAKLPAETIEGGERQVELELGEVIFAPGSAEVRERYLPAIGEIAAKIAGYRGGEVVISADGENEALAFDRAAAVKAALLDGLPPETAQALRVSVRTDVADPASLVAGVGEDGPRLGTVLFDTDRDAIRPEFAPLLDRIAAHLEQAQGGTVSIVGHADRRGADAYNLDLGMRRARAVYEALAERLGPEVRSRVRVETSDGPAAPAGDGQ